jgi:cytochrome c-type biogenesis protein CcmE
MTPKQRRRFAFAGAMVAAGGVLAAVVVYELKGNTEYFFSPSDVAAKNVEPGVPFRVGGLVQKASVHHGAGADIRFTVTDGAHALPVDFNGVLPALFREGQGVIATGALNAGGTFQATEVLAKHDEKYMPPEVVQALKRAGRWKEGEQ